MVGARPACLNLSQGHTHYWRTPTALYGHLLEVVGLTIYGAFSGCSTREIRPKPDDTVRVKQISKRLYGLLCKYTASKYTAYIYGTEVNNVQCPS